MSGGGKTDFAEAVAALFRQRARRTGRLHRAEEGRAISNPDLPPGASVAEQIRFLFHAKARLGRRG